jgi:hypothetical protein
MPQFRRWIYVKPPLSRLHAGTAFAPPDGECGAAATAKGALESRGQQAACAEGWERLFLVSAKSAG